MSADSSNPNLDLVNACMRCDHAGIEDALGRRANPNCRYQFGNTPLILLAMHGGKPSEAVLLTDAGADPSLRNERGRDAYFTAVGARNLAMMTWLEAMHMDKAIRDVHGLSSTFEAGRVKASAPRQH